MGKTFRLIIGLLMLLLGVVSGDVQGETVCLHEHKILKWNLTSYSNIIFAYIKHGRDLIVTIQSPNVIIIDEKFKNRTQINVTETWVIEMTIHNVTFDLNGKYTCTIGLQRDLKIHKEISVIDPDITLFLNTTYNDCKTLRCSAKYNVSLLGPNKRKPKSDVCLFKEDNGRYSCCLVNESICPSTYCKYIDVRLDAYRNTEKNTPRDLDKQNIGIIVGLIVMTVTILILLAIIIGLRITKRAAYTRKVKTVLSKRNERPDTTVAIELLPK